MTGEFGFGAAGSSPPRQTRRPDLVVHGAGTVYLLSPVGHAWIEDHISPEASRLGTAVAAEHRFILDIVRGAVRDGLRVR
jgi:hypothetical protein